MKSLHDATEKICELKGSMVALDALLTALLHELPPPTRQTLLSRFQTHAEVARTVMLHAPISEHTLEAFERDVTRMVAVISAEPVVQMSTIMADGTHVDQPAGAPEGADTAPSV